IRKYGDGKVKANLDIELVVDMMKTARNLDVAIVVSGDGDFAPAIRAVQEMGVRVEVVSFRGNTSSDLIDVADQFTDIIQMAKVEKGSSRSGRRVAGDGEDLSMTEVPDKLTEGTGRGRSRGVGRGRGRAGETEREPVAASGRSSVRGGIRSRRVEAEPEVPAAAGAPVGGLVALPGEKLSKAALARLEAAVPPVAADEAEPAALPISPAMADEGIDLEAEGQRRRRRRGGRGRGRGRGRGEGGELGELGELGGVPIPVDGSIEDAAEELEEGPAELVASAPRGPRPGAFGSVWDSQIGQSRAPASSEATRFDVDDDDEPAIPEYLVAEQRRGGSSNRAGGRSSGGNRGGRGGAYQVAMDRERYGRGGGGGGINRYPDVSGRTTGGGTAGTIGRGGRDSRRDDRPPVVSRPERERPAVGRSDEPWSEVPPELEALLRAQIATRGVDRPSGAPRGGPTDQGAPTASAEARTEAPTRAPARKPRASTRTRAAAPAASAKTSEPAEAASDADEPKPKPRASTRTRAASTAKTVGATAGAADDGPKPRASTRTRTASTAKAKATPAAADETGAATAPKRRASARKPAASSET
ncbi:MAG: NYN domain-containing protein, partial [Chloroflexota bacterium]